MIATMADRGPVLGWACLAVFVGLGVYGSTLGFGTDRDSVRVIDSAQGILAGGYVRSRSFGFPLHEAASAVLFGLGGLIAVNLGTVCVTACGIVAARALVPAGRRGLVVGVLALCPLLLADGSSAIDFGWDFAAGMALCVAALGFLRGGGSGFGIFAAAGALLLLRPDNVLFVAGVSGAVLMAGVTRWRVLLGTVAAAGIAAACVYLGLNGVGMLASGVTTTRPFAGRLLRAGLFLSAALGPGGILALVLLARGSLLVRLPFVVRPTFPLRAPFFTSCPFLERAAGLCWLLYLPRFVVLPDQLDYLVLPVTLSLVAACAHLPWRQAGAIGVLVCVPSLLTVSLLRRDGVSGAVSFDPALQWGAVPQDFAARRFAARMAGTEMTRLVAARAAAGALHYDTFLPGYVSAGGDLVIGQGHLYRVLALGGGAGAMATVRRARFRAIYACGAALGPNAGWRGWEAPVRAPGAAFSCWLASPPGS